MVKKTPLFKAKSKFEEAQKSEREYWKLAQERILSEEYRADKQLISQEIFNELRASTDNGRLDTLLEIGGGADPMVEYFRGKNGISLDPLAPLYKLEIAIAPLSEVEYLQGIGESLPFKDGSFDGVLLYNCIDHGIDPFKILREGKRVLRRGGAIHLLLDTYSFRYSLYRNIIGRVKPSYEDKKHPHCLRFNSVSSYLKRIGFTEVIAHHDEKPLSKNLKRINKYPREFGKEMIKGHRRLRAYYKLDNNR